MKKLLSAFILACCCSGAFAQQRAQFSQYLFNNYVANPAISGIEDYADVKMGVRRQWVGLEGAPVSYYAGGHMPIGKADNILKPKDLKRNVKAMRNRTPLKKNYRIYQTRPHHGVGALVQKTNSGPLSRTSMQVSYAYHQPLSKRVKLALGMSTGLVRYAFNQDYATFATGNDPAAYSVLVNDIKPDLNAGLWLYSDNFYLGLSGSQLLKSTSDLGAAASNAPVGSLQRHFYATSSVKIPVSEEVALQPSVMVRYANPSPPSVDVNLKASFCNRVWAGVSYRHHDAVAIFAGASVSPLFDVGYAYDATTSQVRVATSGSHELVLGMRLHNLAGLTCPQWMW